MSNIEETKMTDEAFVELINNFEVVGHLTEYGRKAIKQKVKEMQSRIKELEKKLEEANKQLDLDYVDENYIQKQKVKDVVEEAIEIIDSELFKVIMGDVTKVTRLRYLLKNELLEEGG